MNNEISAFERIWNLVIIKSIEICKKELDEEFKEKAKFSICNLESYKDKLREIYIRKREWLKREYLPDEEDPVLDFHKLSAIMCRCIIGIKPFCYDVPSAEVLFSSIAKNVQLTQSKKVDWQVNNVYVNYKLAFLVAEGIVFIDLLYWTQCRINDINKRYTEDEISRNIEKSKIKLDIYKEMIQRINSDSNEARLYHYRGSKNHDNFIISEVIGLMKNDYLKRDFDYLQFSASMFQWQEYTKNQILYEIIMSTSHQITLSELV